MENGFWRADTKGMSYSVEDRIWEDLTMTCAVDPEVFVEACRELRVWEDLDFSYRFEWMCETFEDEATSAMHRFLDVAVCLWDGSIAELMASTDEGDVSVPNAVFYTAATVTLDPETYLLDRREWYLETMRILTETNQVERLD